MSRFYGRRRRAAPQPPPRCTLIEVEGPVPLASGDDYPIGEYNYSAREGTHCTLAFRRGQGMYVSRAHFMGWITRPAIEPPSDDHAAVLAYVEDGCGQ